MICKEKKMKIFENQIFEEERALYGEENISLSDCKFAGEADGESALKECKNINWDINIGTLLRTLVAIGTGQSKFKAVSSLSLKDLQKSWQDTKEAVAFTLTYLNHNFDIENQNLLSSPYFITTLAYFVHSKQKNISEADFKDDSAQVNG